MNYEDGNPMYEVGKKYKSDKITHHKYHEIYNFYLKNLYDKEGSVLEIGVQHGTSIQIWLELFPNAFIYGIDIDKCYEGDRHKIFQCDQSKVEQLTNVKNNIEKDKFLFICDDGSHVPEHQLLTFNILFPLLCEGGIYIIEDIETSYWKSSSIYGYAVNYGHKHPNSIIEIFKNIIDESINIEFLGMDKRNNKRVQHLDSIGSITFSQNCIIITKKHMIRKPYRFSNRIGN
jgi:hypothetical protein